MKKTAFTAGDPRFSPSWLPQRAQNAAPGGAFAGEEGGSQLRALALRTHELRPLPSHRGAVAGADVAAGHGLLAMAVRRALHQQHKVAA